MAGKAQAQVEGPLQGGEVSQLAPARTRRKGPTAAEFVASLSREHIENMRWALLNADELSDYEGRWVVIASQRVYCAGDSLEEVEQQARRAGLDKRDILIEYVYPFDVTLVVVARGATRCRQRSV